MENVHLFLCLSFLDLTLTDVDYINHVFFDRIPRRLTRGTILILRRNMMTASTVAGTKRRPMFPMR